ncbi:hypothetical protein KSP39_PZI002797 [Platanthera zijinensis]|uniref:Probable magnesium transporter n=1 Tax=Platanthera zijinensis TaxID=2320716 RepID=A0AAP0C0M1_9ASPA
MGFSKDNLKGFILALLSSGFIGASFIIKKKGLRKAASASGIRAGVGGYAYLFEPLWWAGMITMIVGEIANFVAYAFAPAVLVTPLGALSIIVSAFLAHFILKERLHNLGILGCVMCIAGSMVVVIHAPQERQITSVQEIWEMATQTSFLLYVASVLVLVFVLVCHFSPRYGHSNVLVFVGICSLMGSLSVMSVKALGTSLKLTFEGNNQLVYPETWFFMLVVLTCVITQMNYLNKDWEGQSGGNIISEICGFVIVLSGTNLLRVTKDFDRSIKGIYEPVSPTLSTCLCNGNGELSKLDGDSMGSPEDICLRRQDLSEHV